MKLVYVKN